jgi:putative endonuclease
MREPAYFVYVMSSLSRTLNRGVTNDLERRVAEHKEGKPGSFTARYNVTRLVYYERFDYIRDAIARENGIKRMLRAQKIALVESMNPQWQDLSEE